MRGCVCVAVGAWLWVAVWLCRGTSVTTDATDPYPNYIRVTVRTPTEARVVVGTRVGKEARITQMDHWSSFPAFKPSGHLIFFNNTVRSRLPPPPLPPPALLCSGESCPVPAMLPMLALCCCLSS